MPILEWKGFLTFITLYRLMCDMDELNKDEKLLLVEYQHQMNFIIFSNEVLLKVALLNTTIIHLIFGAALGIIALDCFSDVVKLILLSLLSILFCIITILWYAASCSTHIKLGLRVRRCSKIESVFKKKNQLLVLACANRDKLNPEAEKLGWLFAKISKVKASFGRKMPATFFIISVLSVVACIVFWILWGLSRWPFK